MSEEVFNKIQPYLFGAFIILPLIGFAQMFF